MWPVSAQQKIKVQAKYCKSSLLLFGIISLQFIGENFFNYYYMCSHSTVIKGGVISLKAIFITFLTLACNIKDPVPFFEAAFIDLQTRYALGYRKEWILPVPNGNKSKEIPGVQSQTLQILGLLRKSFALYNHLLLQPYFWPKVINWFFKYIFYFMS